MPSYGRPYGVAVDGAGNLFIADPSVRRIRKVNAWGIITAFTGTGSGGRFGGDGGPAVDAQLHSPYGVAVDGAGNVYISDDAPPPHPQGGLHGYHHHHRRPGQHCY